jgi:hypothetical protein
MEFVAADNPYPIIPDGIYEAVCFKHDKAYFGKAPKLFLHFEIIAPSEYKGIKLFLPFNMTKNGRLEKHRHCLLNANRVCLMEKNRKLNG